VGLVPLEEYKGICGFSYDPAGGRVCSIRRTTGGRCGYSRGICKCSVVEAAEDMGGDLGSGISSTRMISSMGSCSSRVIVTEMLQCVGNILSQFGESILLLCNKSPLHESIRLLRSAFRGSTTCQASLERGRHNWFCTACRKSRSNRNSPGVVLVHVKRTRFSERCRDWQSKDEGLSLLLESEMGSPSVTSDRRLFWIFGVNGASSKGEIGGGCEVNTKPDMKCGAFVQGHAAGHRSMLYIYRSPYQGMLQRFIEFGEKRGGLACVTL
jgi:hypothetical protein